MHKKAIVSSTYRRRDVEEEVNRRAAKNRKRVRTTSMRKATGWTPIRAAKMPQKHRSSRAQRLRKYANSRAIILPKLFWIWLSLGILALALAGGLSLFPSSRTHPETSSPAPNRIIFQFAGTPVTAQQLDLSFASRSETLSHEGNYVGTSNQLRQIDDYSLFSLLDSVEVMKQLTTQRVASVAVLVNKDAPPQPVSTAAAMQFYLAHPILFARQPAQIHVREIMLHAEATARRVLDQLHRGASFAELAQRYSIDPPTYRDRGGDLGWVKPGQMPDSWDAVAYGLAPSQTSDVFKVLTMYCIVQVIQGPKYDTAPFDALSPSATVVVAQYLQQQQFLTWLSNRIVQEPLDIRDGSIAPLIQQGIADLHQYPDQNVLSDEIFQ